MHLTFILNMTISLLLAMCLFNLYGESVILWIIGINCNCLDTKNVINIDGGCSMGIDEEINNGMILLRIDDMQEFPLLLRDNR